MAQDENELEKEFASANEYIKHVEEVYESEEFKDYCDTVYNDPTMIEYKVNNIEKRRILKFFVSCSGNVRETNKALLESLKWKVSSNYYEIFNEDFSSAESEKKLYIFPGKSKHGYPVIIWKSNRHISKKYKYNETIRYIMHSLEKAISEGIAPYRIIFIIDRGDTTNKNMESMAFMRNLCHGLQVNFPEALHKLIIFPGNFFLNTIWAIVRPLLARSVIDRVVILSEDDYPKYLLSIIPEENIPKCYGGSATNVPDSDEDNDTN